MLEMREELEKVVGGMGNGTMGGSRYNVGDRVMSKSNPDFGVGTVTGVKYYRGWHYYVQMDNGGKMYVPQYDVVPVLLQNQQPILYQQEPVVLGQ